MAVPRARLRQQGLEHDRRYMLLKVEADGGLTNVQIVAFPACARLFQDVEGDDIVVTYRAPEAGDAPPEGAAPPPSPPPPAPLRVPLRPDTAGLATVEIRLFGSNTRAYRMAPAFDAWFSACLGFAAQLVYIGDGQRRVLAHSPRAEARPPPPGSWRASLSSLATYVTGGAAPEAPDWLTFNEAAPFLVATEASLRDVSARLPPGTSADMMRFRPVSNPPSSLPRWPLPGASYYTLGVFPRPSFWLRKAPGECHPGLLLPFRCEENEPTLKRYRTSSWMGRGRGTKTSGRSCRWTAAAAATNKARRRAWRSRPIAGGAGPSTSTTTRGGLARARPGRC